MAQIGLSWRVRGRVAYRCAQTFGVCRKIIIARLNSGEHISSPDAEASACGSASSEKTISYNDTGTLGNPGEGCQDC
eukprot:5067060-Amphidinium_carterae.1